jgi:8-oxo-dGTP diphosphatase
MKIDLVVTGYIFNYDKLLLIHHNKLNLWLPVGGHIKLNETPDDALLREIKEETNLDVKIISKNEVPLEGNVKRILAIPFHVDVHSVSDHDHCSFFYICQTLNPELLQINKELKDYRWVSKSDLDDSSIPIDVRNLAYKAFSVVTPKAT